MAGLTGRGDWRVSEKDRVDDMAAQIGLNTGVNGVWPRPSHEYIPGTETLKLTPKLEAKSHYRKHVRGSDDRTIDQKKYLVTGIRGSQYLQTPREQSQGWSWLELVPEPSNPFDSDAVALDLRESRVGYLGGRLARHYHWRIRALNRAGIRCIAPGMFAEDTACYVVIPTLKQFDKHPAIEDARRRLDQVWNELPQTLQDRIAANRFHLNLELANELCKFRESDPYLFPTQCEPAAFSPCWDQVFRDARNDLSARAAKEQARIKQQRELEKARLVAERESAKLDRDRLILKLLSEGQSRTSISKQLKVGWDTVNRVAKANLREI